MKKKLLFLLVGGLFLLGGCGKATESDIIKDLTKKINNANSYYIEGTLEIVNNEDIYTYDVEVSYARKDNYKVRLVNNVNNHEQIILRNSEGVYVVTPRINKSFKFQSDWPYNNSQVYLLSPLLEDITSDDNRVFEETKDGYKLTVAANYPNNPKLVKQEILLDKNSNIKSVTVIDKDGNKQMEIRIDSPAPFNQVGEILTKGMNVMDGYYNNPEASNAVLSPDGWLHTGDLGILDPDGYLYIKGRSKSLILGPSGQNIYPEEIEDLLNAQPYIAESLVIEREGKLVALVYPDSEAMKQHKISRDTLLKIIHETRKQINQQIPAYSQIARIEIHDEEFEKTPKRSIKRFLYQ